MRGFIPRLIMNAIKGQILRVQRMKKEAYKLSIQEFKEEDKMMADLNRDQLSEGIDAEGKPTPNYVSTSKKSGRIKFFETGKYTSGIKPIFENDGFEMTSNDEKVRFLNPWKKVVKTLGLTISNLSLILRKIQPRIVNELLRL